jgi:hypothetical protein
MKLNLKNVDWRFGFLLGLLLVSIIAVGLTGLGLYLIPPGRFTPEIALTILLLAGVVAFIVVMTIAVTVLSTLGLTSRNSAFGAPEGTIRAIIAIDLVIIFAMTSVYLYGQLKSVPVQKLTAITQQELASISPAKIISQVPNDQDPTLTDVTIQLERNPTSDDFAKQMLTTISTLVVAVAGFYFGTQAVKVSKDTIEHASLHILDPKSPATLESGKNTMTIRLATKPVGMAIEGRVNGRADESLKQIRYDEFEFTRSTAITGKATLEFMLVGKPDEVQTIEVTIQP